MSAGAQPEMLRRGHGASEREDKELWLSGAANIKGGGSRVFETRRPFRGGKHKCVFFGSLGLALPCPGGAGGAGRWSPACPVSATTQKLEKCLEKRFFLI